MSVHPRLSLDAVSSLNWTFEEDLAFWDELGLRHVGLLGRKLEQDRDRKIRELQERSIRSATVIAQHFRLDAPETWERTRDGIATEVETAVATGGTSVYLTPGKTTGRPWGEILDTFAAAVEPSVADATQRGVRLAIEPSRTYALSFVNTLRDAIDVAERTGVAIIVDFGNCWMERDLRGVLRRAAPHIGLVQLCDVEIGSIEQPGRGRLPFGEGELPLRRLMDEVLETGYQGLFDLELTGPAVEAEGYASMLRRGVQKASAFLTEVGVQ